MKCEEEWDDCLDITIRPSEVSSYFGPRPFKVRFPDPLIPICCIFR